MASATGILTVLLALAAAAPWSLALSGSDGVFVAFALAPPLLIAAAVGWREAAASRPPASRSE